MRTYLQQKISQFNQRIIDNAMLLKQDEIDKLNRKYAWIKNECSGIKGSDNNGKFSLYE